MSIRTQSERYHQAGISVADPEAFGVIRSAIEFSFSSAQVASFLRSLERAKLRIRDFETVLRKGMLGGKTESEYTRLGNGDQGMIREQYLAALERVEPELRQRFFKLYAYY